MAPFVSYFTFRLSAHQTDVDAMSLHTDEIRCWRNFAMQRGHEGLDPDRVLNAIRDIYENEISSVHNDHHRPTRPRSRTPHVPQLEWDVSNHPSTARRVRGEHIVTIPPDLAVGGAGAGAGAGGITGTTISNEPVTFPTCDRIIVSCDQVGIIGELARIYSFFQTRTTRAEVDRNSHLVSWARQLPIHGGCV